MKFIPNAVSTQAARALLKTQKNSPQTLFVAGLIGMGATVVLACKATLGVDAILETHESESKKITTVLESVDYPEYSEQDAKKDRIILVTKTTVNLGRLYGPAIVCGVLSVSALAGSHNILSRRNAALAAAYGTMEKAFEGYRSRVREAYGEAREKEIYHDVQPCEIEDPETGKKKTRKIANGGSPYARLFDEFNINWDDTPESNWFFLKCQQEFANQRLQARGHVFLNEIYDALGMERTKEGAVVGWVKDAVDGYIDFGVFNDRMQEKVIDFMVGREKCIWLDFNVDGVIYDKI